MSEEKAKTVVGRKKNKKPAFVVKESHYQARVKKRWRFPRGRHSQVRQMHKGKPAMPQPGYGAPRIVRGLHSSGLFPVVVRTSNELIAINVDKEGAVIASTVGNKRKLELLKLAEGKKISILNVKDIAQATKKITTAFASRKKARMDRLDSKIKKSEDKKKKAEEKKKKEAEDKKEEEKKETKKETGSVEEKLEQEEGKQKKQKDIIQKEITKRQ
jgi:large subunit ribosomal protein L32e